MRAVQVRSLDGPAGLVVADIVEPPAGAGVVIDVHAAGVSFPDLLLSRGKYQRRPELPFVPGVEVAGVVRRAPPEAAVAPGERVAAFTGFGGWAETAVADPRLTFPLPDGMSLRGGAGIVLNYLTAHLALTRRGGVGPGETVLVHGAAGGLGTALVQVAAALGARPIAVVSTSEKARIAKECGAAATVRAESWPTETGELVGDRGIDVVADPVGGDRFIDSIRVLRPEGRLLVLGFAAGTIPSVPANRLLLKNIDVRGIAWGSLIEHEADYPARQWSDLLGYIEARHVRPIDGRAFPLEEAADALHELDNRTATGKITLAVRS
jgi:NADPH:quinone reductase